MTEITRQTVTLINQRNGQERYTRYGLSDVVEMIRKGKLKSGKLIEEQAERPRICFASAIKNEKGKRWTYLYNGMILLEINNLPDRKTAEEIRQETALIDYTLLAFVGADGRSVKLVCQAAERNNWQNPEEREARLSGCRAQQLAEPRGLLAVGSGEFQSERLREVPLPLLHPVSHPRGEHRPVIAQQL